MNSRNTSREQLLVNTASRVLISTIQPDSGGVPAKLAWVVRELQALDLEPVVAWYEPWSRSPQLSVPAHALASLRRPGMVATRVLGGVEGYGIGSWLPELEFTHYLPGRHWRRLIASCRLHLAVTGNPLCAYRYTALQVPFLAWIGSPWEGDRIDRVRHFPWPRRLLDQSLNSPVLRQIERRVLADRRGRLLTISHRTARELETIGGRAAAAVLYLPPDIRHFHPEPARLLPWRLGFSGRYSDPRKNITLLLEATARLKATGRPVELHLTGERSATCVQEQLGSLGVGDRVICHPYLKPAQLAAVLQSLDLFVIPSHQEGLCIAALEAMACGVPVLSTRCGGPEDFVIPEINGALVRSEPEAMAAAITSICTDRIRRDRLSRGALSWVEANASQDAARRIFRRELEQLNQDPSQTASSPKKRHIHSHFPLDEK